MDGIPAPLPRVRTPALALRALSDDRLFAIAAAGDERAFELIYERHAQALYRYCGSIVGNADDAADALQSTMASAFRAIAGERRQIALRPWLFRIAHNECISLLRTRPRHFDIDDAVALEAPADDPAVRQRLRELVADVRELADCQRGALVMRELSGLSYREIGETLGTTEAHARQIVYEARAALHEMAAGRGVHCEAIRHKLSDADGRVLRGRRIRAHLRACESCADFAGLMKTRRGYLAAIAPPMPAGLFAGFLQNASGGGASGAVAGKALAASLAAKAGALVAVTAVAGVGAIEIAHHAPAGSSRAGSSVVRRPSVGPASAPGRVSPSGSSRGAVPAPNRAPAAGHRGRRVPARRHVRDLTAPAPPVHAADPAAATSPQPGAGARVPATRPDEPAPAPPGQANKVAGGNTPPGQAKQPPGASRPPGQAKKVGANQTPPGQAKKLTGDAPAPDPSTQPGSDQTPPGQAKKPSGDEVPPGQAKKVDGDKAAPGQAGD